MDHQNEAFTPETVDKQIDQFLASSPARQQAQATPVHVVQTLQQIYAEPARLQRVWEQFAPRIAQEQRQKEPVEEVMPQTSPVVFLRERSKKVQTHSITPSHTFQVFKRRLNLLVQSLPACDFLTKRPG